MNDIREFGLWLAAFLRANPGVSVLEAFALYSPWRASV